MTRLPTGLPRDVWVLSLVAFLVAVGFGVMVPVLPVFARSFRVSQLAVGAVVSAFALSRLVMSPWCARLNRAIGERAALGLGIGIVAASTAGAGLATTYAQLLVLRGLGGLGSAMFSVAAMTLLLAATDASARGRASALYSGGFLLGGMAGPAVGGALAAVSIRAPFFFYAATLVLAGSAGLLLLRTKASAPAEAPGTGTGAGFGPGLGVIVRQTRYQAACLANFASGWQAQGARSTLVPLLVVEALHRPPAWTGIAFAVAAVVQGVALLPVGRVVDVWGRMPVLVSGLALCAVTTAAIPFAPTIGWLIAALCVFGLGSAALSTAPTALVGDATGGAGGTPVAVFQMSSDVGSILGPLAAGLLADRLGLPAAFAVGAALMAGIGLWSAAFAPNGRRDSVHT